jgi:hypothetical protein
LLLEQQAMRRRIDYNKLCANQKPLIFNTSAEQTRKLFLKQKVRNAQTRIYYVAKYFDITGTFWFH